MCSLLIEIFDAKDHYKPYVIYIHQGNEKKIPINV